MNSKSRGPKPYVNILENINNKNNLDGKKPPPQQYQQSLRN